MTNSKNQILFYTCATGFYENFIIPYVYFAKKHNENSIFEFIVDDLEKFQTKHKLSIDWLCNKLDAQISLIDKCKINQKPIIENSLRFIHAPKNKSDFVYIGDVDIMILEDVFCWHKPIFDAGLPYSNIIREGLSRLSGLHFTKYDAYYPMDGIDDLVKNVRNDEELLYKIVERSGNLYPVSKYYEIKKKDQFMGFI